MKYHKIILGSLCVMLGIQCFILTVKAENPMDQDEVNNGQEIVDFAIQYAESGEAAANNLPLGEPPFFASQAAGEFFLSDEDLMKDWTEILNLLPQTYQETEISLENFYDYISKDNPDHAPQLNMIKNSLHYFHPMLPHGLYNLTGQIYSHTFILEETENLNIEEKQTLNYLRSLIYILNLMHLEYEPNFGQEDTGLSLKDAWKKVYQEGSSLAQDDPELNKTIKSIEIATGISRYSHEYHLMESGENVQKGYQFYTHYPYYDLLGQTMRFGVDATNGEVVRGTMVDPPHVPMSALSEEEMFNFEDFYRNYQISAVQNEITTVVDEEPTQTQTANILGHNIRLANDGSSNNAYAIHEDLNGMRFVSLQGHDIIIDLDNNQIIDAGYPLNITSFENHPTLVLSILNHSGSGNRDVKVNTVIETEREPFYLFYNASGGISIVRRNMPGVLQEYVTNY